MERGFNSLIRLFIEVDLLYRNEKRLSPRGIGQRLLRAELDKILSEGWVKFGRPWFAALEHNRRGYENGYDISKWS